MSISTLSNTVRNCLRPSYVPVVLRKIATRFQERDRQREAPRVTAWCAARAERISTFAESLSPSLWQEASDFAAGLKAHADRVLHDLPVLGGGGRYDLLYFLARVMQPLVIVETGVAAGYSSQAFLSALAANGRGRLYSSDFPYFRLPNPEQHVGVLVDEKFKPNWELYLAGDERNIKRIKQRVTRIDLLHYDSDKSYRGRARALKTLTSLITPKSVIVMDDIQDNWFFRDYLEQSERPGRVLDGGGKYVGLIGL